MKRWKVWDECLGGMPEALEFEADSPEDAAVRWCEQDEVAGEADGTLSELTVLRVGQDPEDAVQVRVRCRIETRFEAKQA